MDLLAKRAKWHAQEAPQPEAQSTVQESAPQPRQHLGRIAAIGLVLVGLVIGGWALLQSTAPAKPVPRLGLAEHTFSGPNGPVTLHDWRDGRSWLTWYSANQAWVGAPLWTDRAWHEQASCTSFLREIYCLSLDPKARGTAWELLGMRLGTLAMLRAGLQPDAGSQPAPIVSAYLTRLAHQGIDVYYRFGLPQSGPIEDGDSVVEYYERALFRWKVGSTDPSTIQLAPLGQMATEQGW